MKIVAVLTAVSVLFAVAAAVLWFISAAFKTPESFSIYVARADGLMGQPLGGNPRGGSYVGHAYSDDLVALANALRRQSKFSAWAASCAAVSALAQIGALIV